MDAERLAGLLDRHAAPLALYAAQWASAADDVVQEAFVRLIDAAPEPRRPVPWLYKVVRNLAVSQRRSDARRRKREAGVASRLWVEPSAAVTAVEVAEALGRLDNEVREIVISHLWGGLTFQEIAEVVGTSDSAAHRRYHAGIETLRACWTHPCANRST